MFTLNGRLRNIQTQKVIVKPFNFSVIFFLLSLQLFFSSLFANGFIHYKMVDIGVTGAESSEAIAINDRGQVLGKFKDCGREYTFLWDSKDGLKILNLPDNVSNLRLNNAGQIAGSCPEGVFVWDSVTGFYNIGTFKGSEIEVIKFNENGLILITYYDSEKLIYVWNKGVKVNLNCVFTAQFQSSILRFVDAVMNESGEVIVSCEIQNEKFQRKTVKSYQWCSNEFRELFEEYGTDVGIQVVDFDNNNNMIIKVKDILSENSNHEDFYFVNLIKKLQAKIPVFWGITYFGQRCGCCDFRLIVKNELPLLTSCLPSKLNERSTGFLQWRPGAEISKLIKIEPPYWFSDKLKIIDQNSSGCVVGTSETIYLGDHLYDFSSKGPQGAIHAFLAIPEFGTSN